jgi:predicted DNA-binding transcriptional regulator AlpA
MSAELKPARFVTIELASKLTAAEMVDTEAIADELGLAREYVTDKVVKRPDFPSPVLKLSRKVVKWARADFERWRMQQARRAA